MVIRKRNLSLKGDPTIHGQQVPVDEKSFLDAVSQYRIFIAFTVRISSVLLTKTFFVPDEYWQSTEVAHQNVFGYGYLTWEWHEKIRSYFYPFVFELYFHCLKLLSMDYVELVIFGPHFIQAILTAFADVSVYQISFNLFHNSHIASLTYLMNLLSWFVFYTGSRTLSNTAEMCFTCIGLSYCPFSANYHDSTRSQNNSLFFSFLFGGIACIIRPTSFIIWGSVILFSISSRTIGVLDIMRSGFKALPLLLILLFGVDYYFYKELLCVHWNFLKFNIIQNIGAFYGSHPFHWYITQGLPVVLMLHMPLAFVGIYLCNNNKLLLFWVSVTHVIVHSCIPHKEFRFLLPILPLLFCYAGYALHHLNKYKQYLMLVFMLVVNCCVSLYFCMVHQKGVVDVMEFVCKESESKQNMFVLYLMPCHSTPYYSYLHQNISMRFLTCHPSKSSGYIEEAEIFYSNPVKWLQTEFNKMADETPSHVIAFDNLSEESKEFLLSIRYSKVVSYFHTYLPGGRIGQYVDVYSKHDNT